jgi:oligopeptide transport system substrate-binding protein
MRRLPGLAAALVASLTLCGCLGSGEERTQEQQQENREEAPTGRQGAAGEQVLRWGFSLEDWKKATLEDFLSFSSELTAGWNVFDPLLKLGDDLRPVPSMAETWEWSDDRRALTFHLRRNGRWTNGDPLTAHDYAYSWRVNLEYHVTGTGSEKPEFTGIAGAEAYAVCKANAEEQKVKKERKKALRTESRCAPLLEKIGVDALDDYTLELRFTSPQPNFLERVGGLACICFAPLHQPTYDRYTGLKPGHIVTSGPFEVAAWKQGRSLTLVKNESWRDADEVALDRIEVRFVREKAVKRALEAGELDVFVDPDPPANVLATGSFSGLGTAYAGLSVELVPDRRQRRAMALAIDRVDLSERASGTPQRPATTLTVEDLLGVGRGAPGFLEPDAHLEEARRLMRSIEQPVREVTLWLNDGDRRDWAGLIKDAWEELGINVQTKVFDWEEYLQLLARRKLQAYLLSWIYDFPDPGDLLELWRCDSPNNYAGFCDHSYDRLLDRALVEQDEAARTDLYGQAEEMLTGPDGAMPAIPLFWYSVPVYARPPVKGLEFTQMGQIDLTGVSIAAD